jgi:hypothetical protein
VIADHQIDRGELTFQWTADDRPSQKILRRDRRGFALDGVDAGDALERALDALRRDGRLAYPNGIEPEPRKRRG